MNGEDALHLPLPGLFADLDAGEGSVALQDDFRATEPLKRLSILEGWRAGMESERRRAIADLYRKMSQGFDAGLALPDRLARFRDRCAVLGVECPHDLHVILQEF